MRLPATSNWKTDACELFLLEPEHVSQNYVDWLNDRQVNRYLESRFAVHTVESTRQFVASCVGNPSTLMLGIRDPYLQSAHVGNIKIGPIDRHHGVGEIGIMIGDRRAWGKGLAAAAIRMLSDIARDELDLRKVTAGCYAGNVGSRKAFLNAGFQIVGERPQHFMTEGGTDDLILMDCLLRPA